MKISKTDMSIKRFILTLWQISEIISDMGSVEQANLSKSNLPERGNPQGLLHFPEFRKFSLADFFKKNNEVKNEW